MIGAAVLQVSPTAGGPLAYLGTFILSTGVYALALHIAARYVLGDVPLRRAAVVGLVVAGVVLLLQQYGAVAFVVAIAVDLILVRYVYRLRLRTTALVTLIHVVVSRLLLVVVLNAYRLVVLGPLA